MANGTKARCGRKDQYTCKVCMQAHCICSDAGDMYSSMYSTILCKHTGENPNLTATLTEVSESPVEDIVSD